MGTRTKQRTLFSGRVIDHNKPTPARNGNAASDQAADRVKVVAPSQYERIYRYFRECGANGATDAEVQAGTGIGGDSERPRRRQLEQRGYVRAAIGTDGKQVVRQDYGVWLATAKPWPADQAATGDAQ